MLTRRISWPLSSQKLIVIDWKLPFFSRFQCILSKVLLQVAAAVAMLCCRGITINSAVWESPIFSIGTKLQKMNNVCQPPCKSPTNLAPAAKTLSFHSAKKASVTLKVFDRSSDLKKIQKRSSDIWVHLPWHWIVVVFAVFKYWFGQFYHRSVYRGIEICWNGLLVLGPQWSVGSIKAFGYERLICDVFNSSRPRHFQQRNLRISSSLKFIGQKCCGSSLGVCRNYVRRGIQDLVGCEVLLNHHVLDS